MHNSNSKHTKIKAENLSIAILTKPRRLYLHMRRKKKSHKKKNRKQNQQQQQQTRITTTAKIRNDVLLPPYLGQEFHKSE